MVLRHHHCFFCLLRVRVVGRLPAFLLGDATGDLQEGHELEGNARLPT